MALGFSEVRRRGGARLERLLARTATDGPRLAVLAGPRGVGKNALVTSFLEGARRDGALTFDLRVEAGAPFSPIDGLVAEARAVLGRLPEGVELACDHGCHELWFNHPVADAADPSRALEQRRVHIDSLRRILVALGRHGTTVVALRDLGQASADVVSIVLEVLAAPDADGPMPQLLLVGVVDGAPRPSLDGIDVHPRVARIHIEAHDEASLREVLERPEVIAGILARTGGRPDVIARLLSAVPPTPAAHIDMRLSGLGPSAQAALSALAIYGEAASIADLSRIAGLPLDPSVKDELLASRLVIEVTDGIALSGDTDGAHIEARSSESERNAHHIRAAELFAKRRRFEAAARSALAAGRSDLAIRHGLAAAQDLGARRAHREAATLLRHLWAGVPSEHRTAIDGPLADALSSSGAFGEATAPARRASEADPDSLAASRRYARALVLAGELTEARRVLGLSAARQRAAGDVRGVLVLESLHAELQYQEGALDDAERLAERVIADARTVAARLDAHQTHAKVALARGHLGEAEARYRAYEFAACEAGSAAHEALAAGGLGVTAITAGDLAAAERTLTRAARLAERARDRKAQALAHSNLAVVAHLCHDYTAARARYEEAIRLLALVGNRSSLARAAYNLGELYETFGAHGRARAMCDYGAQAGGGAAAPRATAEGLLLRGRVAFATGDLAEAQTAFEAARAQLMDLDPLRAVAALAGLARIAAREGRRAEAAALLAEAHEGVTDDRRAELALARAELTAADDEDALVAARRAVEMAESAAQPRVLEEARVLLARRCFARGAVAEAREVLERAEEADARTRETVPDDLVGDWEDRPVRRDLLGLLARGPSAVRLQKGGTIEGGRLGIIGVSSAITAVRHVIERVAPSECSVLVRGESGTGKELVARALHRISLRRQGPLVTVNCAAIVDTLLLSELFGHERGAFTGATARQIGRFEQASSGTLFLDEIGDISPGVQAALLRVLSERSFERIGGRESIRADVRVVAATNRDLEAMVREGSFREDLYYRLNEVSIHLPPLRARREDVLPLSNHILTRIAAERGQPKKRLGRRALVQMLEHRWPGNVRQLENTLRSATLFADGDEVGVPDLNLDAVAQTTAVERTRGSGPMPGDEVTLCYDRLRDGEITLRELKKEIERDLIERALTDSGGNISRAAGLLGMKRPRLSQLVKEYGLRQGGEES